MNKAMIIRRNRGTVYTPNPHIHDHSISCGYVMKRLSISVAWIRVITKLPNSEQSYKGKVKTHNYINRQNQLLEEKKYDANGGSRSRKSKDKQCQGQQKKDNKTIPGPLYFRHF
jgi:hypothetical protein